MTKNFSRILVPAASTVELETDEAGGVMLRVLVGDQPYAETRIGGAAPASEGMAPPSPARLGTPAAPTPRAGL